MLMRLLKEEHGSGMAVPEAANQKRSGELQMHKKLRVVETDSEALIPLRTAADMLGLDPSTIRKRAAGTANLTLIPQGRKLFLVRDEIIAHRRKLIDDARRRTDVLRLVRNTR